MNEYVNKIRQLDENPGPAANEIFERIDPLFRSPSAQVLRLVLARLCASYTLARYGETQEETLKLRLKLLADVMAAAEEHIRENPWPPSGLPR